MKIILLNIALAIMIVAVFADDDNDNTEVKRASFARIGRSEGASDDDGEADKRASFARIGRASFARIGKRASFARIGRGGFARIGRGDAEDTDAVNELDETEKRAAFARIGWAIGWEERERQDLATRSGVGTEQRDCTY